MHAEPNRGLRALTCCMRRLLVMSLLWLACHAQSAWAQTPSPLQEWQYSGGLVLQKLFQPDLPQWRTVAGLAADFQPVYDGASAYRVQGGPVINIQYRDIAYLATGEGIGVNFVRTRHSHAGIGITYDLGRRVSDDYANLHGMGNLSASAVVKLHGSYVLSRRFPLILRVDARQFLGGGQGRLVGDAGVYLPLPGSSRSFVMFAGPSITLATRRYLQTLYGVTPQQSLASGHPVYEVTHSGTAAVGVGFSATKFVSEHWLLNLDAAVSQIRGRPAHSPLVEDRTQKVVAVSVNYNW